MGTLTLIRELFDSLGELNLFDDLEALLDYQSRERRFGKTGEQITDKVS